MADRILVVDDDPLVSAMLKEISENIDAMADIASSGEKALKRLEKQTYDLILMDINMVGMNGFDTICDIRAKGILTPVIIVSGRQENTDTLHGFNIGADDYITKPFNPTLLAAKMKALIRRSRIQLPNIDSLITAGPFSYNTSTLHFYKNNVEIPLSSKENAMMKLFMDNIGRVFTKDMLYEQIWENPIIDEAAVMVYINRLRLKIEDDPKEPKHLKNIRGLGYRFIV